MTLGIVLLCEEGVVVGSDRKTVQEKGVTLQRKTSKINQYSLANERPILCCNAGAKTVAERMLVRIDPSQFDFEAKDEPRFTTFMTEVVERQIPQFAQEYRTKHGEPPNTNIAIGTVLESDQPAAATVYPDGTFDYEDQYTAIGSGSLLAELFLRDNFAFGLDLSTARKFVGYIIQRVSEIDSNVEGVEVRSINLDQEIESLDPAYLAALQSTNVYAVDFSMNIRNHIDQLDQMAQMYAAPEEADSEDEGTEHTDG